MYLAETRELFLKWKTSRNCGLTHETFTACIQSVGAIPELALHLIRNYGFCYALLGKFCPIPLKGVLNGTGKRTVEVFSCFQNTCFKQKKNSAPQFATAAGIVISNRTSSLFIRVMQRSNMLNTPCDVINHYFD